MIFNFATEPQFVYGHYIKELIIKQSLTIIVTKKRVGVLNFEFDKAITSDEFYVIFL